MKRMFEDPTIELFRIRCESIADDAIIGGGGASDPDYEDIPDY